eukprot:scaffold243264_cov45-Prasinocladus_malaysianus.AAC.3
MRHIVNSKPRSTSVRAVIHLKTLILTTRPACIALERYSVKGCTAKSENNMTDCLADLMFASPTSSVFALGIRQHHICANDNRGLLELASPIGLLVYL